MGGRFNFLIFGGINRLGLKLRETIESGSFNDIAIHPHRLINMENPDTTTRVSMESLMINGSQINRVRVLMCIVSGIICGILGLTGLQGLLFFIITSIVTDLALITKMKFNLKEYTNSPIYQFLPEGLSSTVMSFILFWTLSFAVVYIY